MVVLKTVIGSVTMYISAKTPHPYGIKSAYHSDLIPSGCRVLAKIYLVSELMTVFNTTIEKIYYLILYKILLYPPQNNVDRPYTIPV